MGCSWYHMHRSEARRASTKPGQRWRRDRAPALGAGWLDMWLRLIDTRGDLQCRADFPSGSAPAGAPRCGRQAAGGSDSYTEWRAVTRGRIAGSQVFRVADRPRGLPLLRGLARALESSFNAARHLRHDDARHEGRPVVPVIGLVDPVDDGRDEGGSRRAPSASGA